MKYKILCICAKWIWRVMSLLQWAVRRRGGGGGDGRVIRNWLPIWIWAIVCSIFFSAKSLDLKLICYIEIGKETYSIWNRIKYLTYHAYMAYIPPKWGDVLGQADRMSLVWKIVFSKYLSDIPKTQKYFKNCSFLTNTLIGTQRSRQVRSLSLRAGLAGSRIILCTICSTFTSFAQTCFRISKVTLFTH